jgi:glucokinase
MEPHRILAADIGGTKVALAVFEQWERELRPLREAEFASKEYASFEQLLASFLKAQPRLPLRAGCFAVAGPVIDGRCRITNLSWTLEEAALAQTVGAPRVKLLNDVEAAAYGMLYLPPTDLSVLNPSGGRARKGNIAVVSVGTGLGESMLYWDGTEHHPVASEGGHADFAPRTEQEIALLRHLAAKFGGHVSYERVLSGPGLHNIYTFLRDSGYAPEPAWLGEELQRGDPNAVITRVALAGEEPLCVATLDMFSSILGAEAGNLALKCFAVGGVFVAGGIAPKILAALQKGSFMRGFTDKGRFAELLQSVEVCVALEPRAPLLGAAHFALRL